MHSVGPAVTDRETPPALSGIDTTLRDVVVVLFAEGIVAAAAMDLIAPWPTANRIALALALIVATICMFGIRHVPWTRLPPLVVQGIPLSALLLAALAIAASGGWNSPFIDNLVLVVGFAAYVGPRRLALAIAVLAGLVAASPYLYDPAGMPTMVTVNAFPNFIGLALLITILAQRTRALLIHEHAARAQAEAASRVRDEFLTGASHDLRTPLGLVLGRAQRIRLRISRGQPLDPAWLSDEMDSLWTGAQRLSATVDEITDAAHLQMGQALSLETTAVDIVALVQRAARLVSAAHSSTRIEVEATCEALVEADPRRLERVLQNVIANAVKYSRGEESVLVGVHAQNNWVTITVHDHGVGIPHDELPHLFTHFFRASTAISIAGSGIGLAGAKQIVEQHGGRIQIQSVVGAWTTVTVDLPQALPASGSTGILSA